MNAILLIRGFDREQLPSCSYALQSYKGHEDPTWSQGGWRSTGQTTVVLVATQQMC